VDYGQAIEKEDFAVLLGAAIRKDGAAIRKEDIPAHIEQKFSSKTGRL
jgi:hypothetical protein